MATNKAREAAEAMKFPSKGKVRVATSNKATRKSTSKKVHSETAKVIASRASKTSRKTMS